jgi:hypothetical protein
MQPRQMHFVRYFARGVLQHVAASVPRMERFVKGAETEQR